MNENELNKPNMVLHLPMKVLGADKNELVKSGALWKNKDKNQKWYYSGYVNIPRGDGTIQKVELIGFENE